MESRLKISCFSQRKFLKDIKLSSGLTWKELAKIYKISDRTLRDWASAKFFMSYIIAIDLSNKFSIPLPKNFKILPRSWHLQKAASKGGLKRQELYGLLGNIESRKKGGIISQQKRKENPEKYKLLGCLVRKKFKTPLFSEELAELIGIILGDGALNNAQLRITLSRIVDKKYAIWVRTLIGKIIGEVPSWGERKNDNTIELTLSGVGLVEVLEKLGLIRGNKVRNQVGFPQWILKERRYRIACIRGLFDTDGGFYFHHHYKWKDKRPYLGWSFTNFSIPILKEFQSTLNLLGLNPKNIDNKKLYMYSIKDLSKYMDIVGTHNPKNVEKYKYYKKIRSSVYKNL